MDKGFKIAESIVMNRNAETPTASWTRVLAATMSLASSGVGWHGRSFVLVAACVQLLCLSPAASAQAIPTYQLLKSIGEPATGSTPRGDLIRGKDGALYGTASYTVFKLNPDGSGFTVLKYFDNLTTGNSIFAGLAQGTDGALYGTASSGGSGGSGTVFKLNQDGTGFAVLHNFINSTDGGNPRGKLIQATDGALYGTTNGGGSNGYGTVFKLNPDGTGFTVLKNLDTSSGIYPAAGLIQGTDGALYGTARQCVSNGLGTVFKLHPNGTGFTVLQTFNSSNGALPEAGLMQGPDGALYGASTAGGSNGYGTVFKLNPDGTGFTILKNLDNFATGSGPVATLIIGTDGLLYGTASGGGSYNYGTVFKMNTNGTGFSVLENFNGTNGYVPAAGLTQGTDGDLYGTAMFGGSLSGGSVGTIFKMKSDGSGFVVLKEFSAGSDLTASGGDPYAGVIQGVDGSLYGTAVLGGGSNWGGQDNGGPGTVFKINQDGTGFIVLQNLDFDTTGMHSFGGVIQGTDGALYGTTISGGGSDSICYGTIFKLNPDGTAFTILHYFSDITTGGYSDAGLLQGTDGALFGTTSGGGIGGYGTVFRMNVDGTGFTVLHDFDYTTGTFPHAGLIQGPDGIIYGTASGGGGTGNGTVFSLNSDGTGFAVLKDDFDLTTGINLRGKLLQGRDGALYGMTYSGGSNGLGTVFKINPDGTCFTVLANLDPTTGSSPNAGLLQGTDGALYGMTTYGGTGENGTAFRLNPDGTGFSVLLNFESPTTGAYPYSGFIQGSDGNLYGTTTRGGSADSGTVFRLVLNSTLIANAGLDSSVDEGQLVTLDGSGSGAPGGEPLTYSWAQLPGGTTVTLSNADTAYPTFAAPYVAIGGETLSFELTITANGQTSKDSVNVMVVNVNHTPVADAGIDLTVAEGAAVTLHGEDSFDVDNDPLTDSWVQVSGTPTVILNGASTRAPTFMAPFVSGGSAHSVVATLVFELRVADGFPADAPAPGYTTANVADQVTVFVTNINNSPIADADVVASRSSDCAGSNGHSDDDGGDDHGDEVRRESDREKERDLRQHAERDAHRTVNENSLVMLDGSGSTDPDGDALTYSWTQTGGPAVTLSSTTSAMPSFTAPFVGCGGATLAFTLTVSDGYGGSDTDTVSISVRNVMDPPVAVNGRPTTCVLWPPNHGRIAVGIKGVGDEDDPVTITITSVTQDEPTFGLGDGDTKIDAVIRNDGTVLLRAERSASGNGRVYHIHFTASNAEGSSSAVVTVSVPMVKGGVAVDGGELYDSTR